MSKLYLQHDYKVTGRDYVETDGGDTPAGGIDYSTEEQDTGLKWIDGSPIYQKTIECGAPPNNNIKQIAHGITGLNFVVEMFGTGVDSITGWLPIPLVQATSGTTYQIKIVATASNIEISTGTNLSSVTNIYVTLRYTKITE